MDIVSKWYKSPGVIIDLSLVVCVCFNTDEGLTIKLTTGQEIALHTKNREDLFDDILKALLEYENGYNDSMIN